MGRKDPKYLSQIVDENRAGRPHFSGGENTDYDSYAAKTS